MEDGTFYISTYGDLKGLLPVWRRMSLWSFVFSAVRVEDGMLNICTCRGYAKLYCTCRMVLMVY